MKSADHLIRPVGAAVAGPSPEPEGLRERKKRLTREAIFAAAGRLFDARGFENVTVAEIADAANVSVKTVFTYVSAKEELLFRGQPTVLDAVVRAVANRRLGQTPLVAAAQALLAAVSARDENLSLEAFQRMISSGPAPGPWPAPAGRRRRPSWQRCCWRRRPPPNLAARPSAPPAG
jgi:AcrR family transcriptional regulator